MILNVIWWTVEIKKFQREEFLYVAYRLVLWYFGKESEFFLSCLKSLSEDKVKNFGLIPLAEEISKQPSIDSVLWLLIVTLVKIYNEKEQAE